MMRSSRLVKYRKKYMKLIIAAQIVGIWYALLLTAAVLTSNTEAYFSAENQVQTTISTGTWEEERESELEFIGGHTQTIKDCPPLEITAKIKNNGSNMENSTTYQLYYVKNGNPKQNGEKIAEGEINPIEKGETISLTHEVGDKGSYMFKAMKYPGDEDNQEVTWSEKIDVKCNGNNKPHSKQDATSSSNEPAENTVDEHDEPEQESDQQEKTTDPNESDAVKEQENSDEADSLKEQEDSEDATDQEDTQDSAETDKNQPETDEEQDSSGNGEEEREPTSTEEASDEGEGETE